MRDASARLAADQKNRLGYIDLVKAVGCLFVILIHTSVSAMYYPACTREWYFGLFWKTVSFSAVPLFLMCTGALMLRPEKPLTIRRLYTRYIPRLLIALLGWALFYRVVAQVKTGGLTVESLPQILSDVLLFRHDDHLYYLHIALLCYALLPLLRFVTAQATRNQLRYLLLIWFVLGSVVPCVQQYLPFVIRGIPGQSLLNLTYSSIGMVLAGYYFSRYPLKPLAGALFYAGGASGTFLIVRALKLRGMNADMMLYGSAPLVLMMAAGLFCLAQAVPLERLPGKGRLIRAISKSSFGIYLVHLFVLREALRLNPLFYPQIVSIPLTALAVLAVSFCVSRLLSFLAFAARWLFDRLCAGSKRRRLMLYILLPVLAAAGICILIAVQKSKPQPPEETPQPLGTRTTEQERTLGFRDGEVQFTLTAQRRDNAKAALHRGEYALQNGDTVISGRFEADESCGLTVLEQFQIPAESGTVTWYDADAGDWVTAPFAEQSYTSGCIFLDTERTDLYFWPPAAYETLENNSLKALDRRGTLRLERVSGGWSATLCSPRLEAGQVCDYTVVSSDAEGRLLDLDYKSLRSVWKNYTQTGTDRWCCDGYYFPAPDNYVPTDCIYRCPAGYLVASMVTFQNESRVADDLSLMMLDTMARQQCEAGYLPTPPMSKWLQEEYGIGSGFFDTRFNTDILPMFCKSWHNHGGFEAFMQSWADWFCSFAEMRRFDTENGGWLVCDYGGKSLQTPLTHCSLNHQVSEIITLLRMSHVLDDERLRPLAERMLLGLEDCGDRWIREDGNLHYAYYPDGSFGGDDYPYLTYNDMYNLQQLLETEGYGRSRVLDRLMEAKRVWMDDNGVADYKK